MTQEEMERKLWELNDEINALRKENSKLKKAINNIQRILRAKNHGVLLFQDEVDKLLDEVDLWK